MYWAYNSEQKPTIPVLIVFILEWKKTNDKQYVKHTDDNYRER